MKKYYRSHDIAALDSQLQDLGVPAALLMENVGCSVADCILARFSGGSCVICAGSGGNGGDGFAAARHLSLAGWHVNVLLSHSSECSSGASAFNLNLLRSCGIEPVQSSALDDCQLSRLLATANIIIDALLGTGTIGNPRGETARLIQAINAASVPVCSVDIPSGISGDGSCVVNATFTCVVAALKEELATGIGSAHCGEKILVTLGVPFPTIPAVSVQEPGEDDIVQLLPARPLQSYKGSRGGVLVIAGSPQYRGAALLACRGALRTGAGLVVLASVESVLNAAAVQLPEVILQPLDDGTILPQLLQHWRSRCGALLVGSGLARDARAESICRTLIAAEDLAPSVWDGDGLYWISRFGAPHSADFCLTPHEGEAATLLQTTAAQVSTDRLGSARNIAKRFGPVLLKGYRSLVSAVETITTAIATGNQTLSVPGSGDVLGGAISAFLAAGIGSVNALTAAAWIHGQAGEDLGIRHGIDGVLAAEVADELPNVIRKLRNHA